MIKFATFSLACWTILAAFAHPALARTNLEVIYGDDDRKDLFDPDANPEMVDAARSTAALVHREQLQTSSGNMSRLPTDTFGDAYGLCETEPFREQPNPAFCSGFLVAPDVFVTAGHCITNATDCAGTAMVFGFGYATRGQDVTLVKQSDVFYCKEILDRKQNSETKSDYAVVRLDRAVPGRAPLHFRQEGLLDTGAEVTVIGHPAGLPTKVAGGARVRTSDNVPFFVANTDTYGGNSGSAVLNGRTGEVEGVLVRGENDFETQGGCMVSKHCASNGCRGEDVTRATEFAPAVLQALSH